MRQFVFFRGVVFLFSLTLFQDSFAAKYFVAKTASSSVSKENRESSTELIKTAVEEAGETLSDNLTESDFELKPNLLRLGSSYVLSLSKKKNGKTIFRGKLKAARIEELDRVASRLTRAVIREVGPAGDATVSDVTEVEKEQGKNRRAALAGYYFGVGPAWMSKVGDKSTAVYLSGAYTWDLNQGLLKIGTNWLINGGSYLACDLTLGGSYFLLESGIAPFVGLEFGFGGVYYGDDSFIGLNGGSGFVLAPVIGAHFFRTHRVNLELAYRAGFLLKDLGAGNPVNHALRVGFIFLR